MDNMPDITLPELPPVAITFVDGCNADEFAPLMEAGVWRAIKHGGAFALGAAEGGVPCGLIAAHVDAEDTQAELLWVYVTPDKRRSYIGSTLFCELADMLGDSDQFELRGIACEYADDGGPLRPFLDSLRFEQQHTDNRTVGLSMSEVHRRDFMQGSAAPPHGCMIQQLGELSPYHIKQLNAALDKNEANYMGAPVTPGTVDPELSFALYEGGEPTGCICFVEGDSKDDGVMLALLYAGTRGTHALSALLRRAGEALCARYDGDTLLKIPLIAPSAQRLADFLLGADTVECERMMQAVFFF